MTLVQEQLFQYITLLEKRQQEALLTIVEAMIVQEEKIMNGETEEEFDINSIPIDPEPTESEKEMAYLLANTDKGKPTEDFLSYAGSIPSEEVKLMEDAINNPIWGCNVIETDEE